MQEAAQACLCGAFPQIGDTISGVPITRIIAFWGSILGSPIFGKYHIPPRTKQKFRLSARLFCLGAPYWLLL